MDLIAPLSLAEASGGAAETVEFTALDFETTDLTPGRLIEIGAVRTRADGTVLGELSTLVDPGPGVDPGATWLHHITRERLDGAPTIDQVIGPLLELCEGSVLVAHNLEFEGRFLAHELDLLGIDVPTIPGLCTLEAARAHLTMPNHRLGTLVNELSLDAGMAHAALDDARACGRLLVYMLSHGLALATRPTFPSLPRRSGTTRFKPRASGLYAGRRGWLAALMDRLPISHPGTADPALAEAYLSSLTDALATGRITRVEARSLARQAEHAGMSGDDVRLLHTRLLDALHQAATDLTPARAAELHRAAALLGLRPRPTPPENQRRERVLVLGEGAEAEQARRLAAESGAEVARRLTGSVTLVVTAGDFDRGEPRIARARSYGIDVVTIQDLPHRLDGAG